MLHTPSTRTSKRPLLLTLGTVTAIAAAVLFAPLAANAAEPGDDDFLGVVEDYAIVSADTITDTDTHGTVVIGDVALTPGTDQQLLVVQVSGDIHVGDTDADTANLDLNTAYVILANTAATDTVGTVNLAARVTPYGAGVYFSGSDLLLDGEMFLDGGADDVFVFQASTGSLTVLAESVVTLLGAVQACNVYWQVGSSATLGVDSEFVGTLLAATSISAQDGAQVIGQLLAGATNAGAVTLDDNLINAQSGCVRATESQRLATEAAEADNESDVDDVVVVVTGDGSGSGERSGGSVGAAVSPTRLAVTGVNVAPSMVLAALLVLTGFGGILVARRSTLALGSN